MLLMHAGNDTATEQGTMASQVRGTKSLLKPLKKS